MSMTRFTDDNGELWEEESELIVSRGSQYKVIRKVKVEKPFPKLSIGDIVLIGSNPYVVFETVREDVHPAYNFLGLLSGFKMHKSEAALKALDYVTVYRGGVSDRHIVYRKTDAQCKFFEVMG